VSSVPASAALSRSNERTARLEGNCGRSESIRNLSKGICEGVRWTGFHQLYSFLFLLKRAIGLV